MARERRPELLAPILAEATGSTARLNIYGYFDSDGAPYGVSADEFGKVLADLPDDTDTIDLHIHSRGGDVFEAVAVAQQLREHKAIVNATVDGLAASSASFVAASSDNLTMTPDSSLMIHNGSVSLFLATLNAEDCARLVNSLTHVNDKIAGIYAAKAGGSVEDWRAAMAGEQWYSADEAVAARLADGKSGKRAEAAVAASLDTSNFAYAGRADAPAPFMPITASQTPAEPPVSTTPPTDHKEADLMSDTLSKGLRERLGVADDATEDDILGALDEALAEQATTPTVDAKAKTDPVIPEGKTLVSDNVLAELRDMAQAGVQARAKQLADERDETITAAFTAGKISAERRPAWSASWDKDPEGTKADLESLPVRFPVGDAPGVAGTEQPTAAMSKYDAEFMAGLGFNLDDTEATA